MHSVFNKLKKSVAVILVAGFFVSVLSIIPTKSALATDGGAGWTFNAMWGTKEFGLDTAARFLAQQMLSLTINTMIKKIQGGGRTGRDPSFIQDWRNFITNAQYRGEDVFRSVLSQTVLCGNVTVDVKRIFNANNRPAPVRNHRTNSLNPFTQRARCTMPNGWDEDNFRRDFVGNGGWEALARLGQPENNFQGVLLMSLGEVAAQRALDTNSDIFEGTSGQGFTGIKLGQSNPRSSCDDPPVTGGSCIEDPFGQGIPGRFCNDSGNTCVTDADCRVPTPSQARCTFLGKTYTPAKLLGEATAQTIDKKLGWLVTSDEVSEVLVAIISAVMDRLNNFMLDTKPDIRASQGAANGSITDPYTQCVQKCNGRSGDAFGVCIERCSTGAPLPGTAPNPAPTVAPPPVPPRSPIPLPAGATKVTVNLQTVNSQFIGAEGGGGSTVIATATSLGIWETFVIYDLNGGTLNSGDQVAITTFQFNALRAEGGGGTTLDATATGIGPWETFVIESTDGLTTITSGSHVSFRTWNLANFIRSEGGGGSTVDASSTSVGSWETYTINIP